MPKIETLTKFALRGLTVIACLAASYLFLNLTAAALDTSLIYGGF